MEKFSNGGIDELFVEAKQKAEQLSILPIMADELAENEIKT